MYTYQPTYVSPYSVECSLTSLLYANSSIQMVKSILEGSEDDMINKHTIVNPVGTTIISIIPYFHILFVNIQPVDAIVLLPTRAGQRPPVPLHEHFLSPCAGAPADPVRPHNGPFFPHNAHPLQTEHTVQLTADGGGGAAL